MSWLDWLKGRSGDTTTTENLLDAPGEFPLIPKALTVFVEDHVLQSNTKPLVPLPEFPPPGNRCRSYLTRGLMAKGQREVMFVLAPLNASLTVQYERDVLHLLQLLYKLADDGRSVDSPGISVFGEKAPFGLSHCGIAYLDPIDGPGPPVPKDHLLAILLRPEECAAAMIGGVNRVAAWIAFAYRLFPYPKFSDPSRPTAIPTTLREETVLAKLPLVVRSSRQANAFLQNKTVTVRLDGNIVDELEKAFAYTEGNPCFGILTGHIPNADGRFVWLPKSSPYGANVIGLEGSSMSLIEGGFVGLVGAQTTNRASVVEDGFYALLRSDSWAALRESIKSRADIEIAMAGDEDRYVRQLRIECR